MEERALFSNAFDGLTCGYQILKRGYDKEKNKNYEYTINFGKFNVEDGRPRFRKNTWKTGAVTLDDDYMDNSAQLFVQEAGSITGSFPVFTSTKKKRTKMVEIFRAKEGSSLAAKSNPMGKFVTTRDGSESTFILKVNSCN